MDEERISVITPVRPSAATHLTAAYDSLRAQRLPPGWSWEWLVQEDGQTGVLSDLLPGDDPRISLATGRPGGAAIARNMALARASGDLVKVLDADDQLTAGALARDIETLTGNPDIGWTTCQALDLLTDGRTIGCEHAPPPGRLARGAVLAHWQAHDYQLPVHPATLCIRRGLVIALGGWMALPASADTGLLLAAGATADGWFVGEPGLLYRKRPRQVTAQPAHTETTERNARMGLIAERAQLLSSRAGLRCVDSGQASVYICRAAHDSCAHSGYGCNVCAATKWLQTTPCVAVGKAVCGPQGRG